MTNQYNQIQKMERAVMDRGTQSVCDVIWTYAPRRIYRMTPPLPRPKPAKNRPKAVTGSSPLIKRERGP
jgi:hypothetical protein